MENYFFFLEGSAVPDLAHPDLIIVVEKSFAVIRVLKHNTESVSYVCLFRVTDRRGTHPVAPQTATLGLDAFHRIGMQQVCAQGRSDKNSQPKCPLSTGFLEGNFYQTIFF